VHENTKHSDEEGIISCDDWEKAQSQNQEKVRNKRRLLQNMTAEASSLQVSQFVLLLTEFLLELVGLMDFRACHPF
jgi:hypothetical protein